MRFIDIQKLSPAKDRVRRIEVAERPEGTMLGVIVGDESRTHTVHWLRFSDGAEIHRRSVPVSGTPDPAFSPDLSILAYAEIGQDEERIVLEHLDEPEPGRRVIPLPPDWCGWDGRDAEGRMQPRCFYLAINCNAEEIRASIHGGALFIWNIRDAFKSDAPIKTTEEVTEEFPPVVAMAHARCERLSGAEGYVMACERGQLNFCFPSNMDAQLLYGSDYQKDIRAIAISRDGAFFAVAQDDQVDLWDATKTPHPTLIAIGGP